MKRVYSTSDFLTDRERKNLLILDAIRRERRITKTDISKITKLNIVTVSNYVNGFLEKGLIVERGLDVSEGGRRPLLLELNPQAGYVVGLGLSMTEMVGVVTDLSGKIHTKVKRKKPTVVATRTTPLTQESAREIINSLIVLTKDVITESKLEHAAIKGIGMGIPGLIDETGQSMRWPSMIGAPGEWKVRRVSVSMPVKTLFEEQFGVPTFIENDATVAAFGVLWLGLEPGFKDILYMYSEVGSGIIINGEVYRGASGGAGEISIDNPFLDKDAGISEKQFCDLGENCYMMRGLLDLGITNQMKEALKRGKESILRQQVDDNIEKIDAKMVIEAARDGDELSMHIVEKASENLGVKVSFLVNFLNPQVVVIGGGIEEAGAIVIDTIRRIVRRCAFEEIANVVKIIPSRLGENAVALGAACLVIQSVFAQA